MRARRPCRHPGCHELTNDGLCEKHRLERGRDRERGRPNSAGRGYDGRWRKFRAQYLRRHPMCEAAGGCDQVATDAHHVVRMVDGGAQCDEGNLQALCGEHHDGLGGAGGRA
jgi:5-methylcytosine-specific restriction protein A